MILEYSLYKHKLEDFYYIMIKQQNIDYRDKHGVGPYEHQGRHADRINPYLDTNYWLGYHDWLKNEFNAVLNNNRLAFASEKEGILFLLRWG